MALVMAVTDAATMRRLTRVLSRAARLTAGATTFLAKLASSFCMGRAQASEAAAGERRRLAIRGTQRQGAATAPVAVPAAALDDAMTAPGMA